MASENLDTFLRRAEDFSRGMGLLRDDDPFTQSAALLAVHASIAYADALRVGFGDSSLSSDDHQTAAASLERLLPTNDQSGVARFRKLLASKSIIAYGRRRISVQQLRLICIESERFAIWANKIGRVSVVGWRHEND